MPKIIDTHVCLNDYDDCNSMEMLNNLINNLCYLYSIKDVNELYVMCCSEISSSKGMKLAEYFQDFPS